MHFPQQGAEAWNSLLLLLQINSLLKYQFQNFVGVEIIDIANVVSTYTGSNPPTVVPVKALESLLVENSFFFISLSLLLYQPRHLTTLHILTAVSPILLCWASLFHCLPSSDYINLYQTGHTALITFSNQRIFRERKKLTWVMEQQDNFLMVLLACSKKNN